MFKSCEDCKYEFCGNSNSVFCDECVHSNNIKCATEWIYECVKPFTVDSVDENGGNMDNFIEIYEDHVRVREATKQGYAIAMGGILLTWNNPIAKLDEEELVTA